ncbi:4a-hydroxytetrahydrobiopterin dehydratase [Streptomyces qinzhouensis]|uniref:Putative pterin-4-alpha-carbinolamine dehydratase n=1 Tax=Streptomyces qinzhouensis TaxID=2599401 RepID=A0A5B8JA71_9ACTN|nr:4a-hydroxytetrahydrobiopterin dehydratase [Streptomyces qinzhouensis]QDY78257.1 4a-hydroxytetrahydrobiopterin dehydratase [Streptomyces qinzhouensis]
MAAAPLTAAELEEAMTALPDWTVEDGKLTAAFKLDRADVPALYAAVAAAEDEANHHAKVTILYGTIGFALCTHDAGDTITSRDTTTAARLTALTLAHGATPADQ